MLLVLVLPYLLIPKIPSNLLTSELILQEHFMKEFKEPLNLKYIGDCAPLFLTFTFASGFAYLRAYVYLLSCLFTSCVVVALNTTELIICDSADPTYMIRAIPSNASDNVYCTLLAHSAIHGAMAGYCGFTVGPVNVRHCYIPIPVRSRSLSTTCLRLINSFVYRTDSRKRFEVN